MRDASETLAPIGTEMRNASPPEKRISFVCACCRRTVVTAVEGLFYNPAVGSTQRFCSQACRQAAWRRRRAGIAEDAPLQYHGGRSRHLRPRAERNEEERDDA